MKTEEIVRSLRWCGTGTEESCDDCAFEPQRDEDAVGCVGGLCDTAADRLEELVDRCACYAEEIAVLQKDWSDLRTVIGECGGLDRIKELDKADKDGRIAILPCEPGGVMLDMSDLERPVMMERLHFAVAYVRCGIVFHQPYKIFQENVTAGNIRLVSGWAGKMLGKEVWP